MHRDRNQRNRETYIITARQNRESTISRETRVQIRL